MIDVQNLMIEAGQHIRAGRFPQAAECLEQAVLGAPKNSAVWLQLGMMRSAIGELDASADALRTSAALDPRNIDARMCLGILLANQQKTGEADALFREALTLAPTRVDVAHAYSRILADSARTEEALAVIRAAQRNAPNDISLQDKVCCLLNYIAGVSPAEVFAEHKKFGAMVGDPPPMHKITDRSPDRKLRIAYLSGDLREHSVAYFLEPLLDHHDRAAFEVCCYHIGGPDEKATPRLKSKADRWKHLFPITDDALAAAIAADQIDILIELAGHAQGNRLTAVARRAAPITITYIGYPNTTGVPAIGYRIVDNHTDPPGAEQWATEKLIRLHNCFLCYRPYENSPPTTREPSTDNSITFGSFNNLAKLSAPTLSLWGRLMARIPNSRLMLKGKGLGDDSVRTRVLSLLGNAGITPDRVELIGHTKDTPEHLNLYRHMDIALDPFPYNGTTTTCEALWMGVPVITLAGAVHAGRVGISLLETVGLSEFIASSEDQYLDIATRLAADRARLADLRANLRERLRTSPLCNGPAYTRNFESALRQAWRDWCASTPPPPRGVFNKLFGR